MLAGSWKLLVVAAIPEAVVVDCMAGVRLREPEIPTVTVGQ
jgi:methylthioribose-1-phosphate isomerase